MEDVLFGRDGTMFLATSVHNILGHLKGEIEIPPESIENFGRNMKTRAEWCAQRGIKYRHVIYPEKAAVMKSFFPVANARSYSDRYRAHFDANVIDLADILPDADLDFLRTDTHLNFNGKVKTTLAVLRQFHDLDEASARAALLACKGEAYAYKGDLGSKLTPPQSEEHFRVVNRDVVTFNNRSGANDGMAILAFNVARLKRGEVKRLLVFGDSFFERAIKMFAVFYSEILFCRTRYFHDEIATMFQPDHVITESAERYFSGVRLDESAPRFNLLYGLRGSDYSRDEGFYRAYNAVLNHGKSTYASFLHGVKTGKYGA
jgi:hypothetical protein